MVLCFPPPSRFLYLYIYIYFFFYSLSLSLTAPSLIYFHPADAFIPPLFLLNQREKRGENASIKDNISTLFFSYYYYFFFLVLKIFNGRQLPSNKVHGSTNKSIFFFFF